MNGVTGRAWIKDDFDAQTRDKANGCYRLLIVDGHTSHFDYELLQYAKANHIVVLCLPAHTTHILQSEWLSTKLWLKHL